MKVSELSYVLRLVYFVPVVIMTQCVCAQPVFIPFQRRERSKEASVLVGGSERMSIFLNSFPIWSVSAVRCLPRKLLSMIKQTLSTVFTWTNKKIKSENSAGTQW